MKRFVLAVLTLILFILSILLTIHMSNNGSTVTERLTYVMCMFAFPTFGLLALNTKTPLATANSKGADVNNQYDYTPSNPDYASSFREGMPVVTTDDYYEGSGYHAWVVKIDRSEDGMPLLIQRVASRRKEWVSEYEVIPEYEMEVVL